MARNVVEDDPWDDEPDEPWDDIGDDEEGETVPCRYCGAEIYEDSVRCPRCGAYISEEDSPASPKPWWIIIGVLFCLAAVIVWMVVR
ncbi:MAG: hypothetical protein ABFC96_06245 [Thermoguttaceae bacterium]